jgi:hypothetical protein
MTNTSPNPSPEIQEQQNPVIEADLRQQSMAFKLAEMPAGEHAGYKDLEQDRVTILAELDAGAGNRFVVCQDKQAKEGESPYYVLSTFRLYKPEGENTYGVATSVTLEPGVPLPLGRNQMGDVTVRHADVTMSRKHATLTLAEDGTLNIADHSTHGTHVKYATTENATQPESTEAESPTKAEVAEAAGQHLDANLDALRANEANGELGTELADSVNRLISWVHADTTGRTPEGDINWEARVETNRDGTFVLKAKAIGGKHGIALPGDKTAHLKTFEINVDENGNPLGDSIKLNVELWDVEGFRAREVRGVQIEANQGALKTTDTTTYLDHALVGTDDRLVKLAQASWRSPATVYDAQVALSILSGKGSAPAEAAR